MSTIMQITQFSVGCKTQNTNQITAKLSELLDSPYRDDSSWKTLGELNQMCDCHGVESVEDALIAPTIWSTTTRFTHGESIAYYLNTGDTYTTTILYDCIREKYTITTMGDFVEFVEKIKYAATEVENFVPFIEWDEWRDNDGNAYFPIRLRVFEVEGGWGSPSNSNRLVEGNFSVYFGSPDFDGDCRGLIASAELVEEMDSADYLETIVSMVKGL